MAEGLRQELAEEVLGGSDVLVLRGNVQERLSGAAAERSGAQRCFSKLAPNAKGFDLSRRCLRV